MSRRAKQVLYGIFYLAVLGGIGTGAYFLFFRPGPSCFDGIQNQGEQGVDCGGPCAPCASVNVQPVGVLGSVRVFSPLPGSVSVLAELENANASSGAEIFDYTVTLYGPDGSTTVASANGSSFIYPDETKYLILPNEPVSSTIGGASIAISNMSWIAASQMGAPPKFSFSNIVTSPAPGNFMTVSGNITNLDASSFGTVLIGAIFKDAAGTPVGASQTEVNSLAPGATQPFSISYPLMPNEDVGATQLVGYGERG